MPATKISVYSLSELKTTLDDHIPLYLTSPNLGPLSTPLPKTQRFTETHFNTTIRLIFGYSGVALILYIFYLDYYLKVPWSEHKLATAWCVIGYTLLNGCMAVWTWDVERGMIFEGYRGYQAITDVRLYSLPPHRKYDPSYRLLVECTKKGREGKRELTVPFTSFFQADGTFVAGEFERWLKGKFPEVFDITGESESEIKKVDSKKPMVVADGLVKDPKTGKDVQQWTEGGKRRYLKRDEDGKTS